MVRIDVSVIANGLHRVFAPPLTSEPGLSAVNPVFRRVAFQRLIAANAIVTYLETIAGPKFSTITILLNNCFKFSV
jgi:hypothetical protein